MTAIKLEAELPVGDALILERVRKEKKEIVPSYSCIGGNMKFQTKVKNYPDLFGELSRLSKGAHWLLWSLIKLLNTTNNEAHLVLRGPKNKAKVARAYKELKEKDMVRRVSRGVYLINPKIMLPNTGCFDKTLAIWNLL